MRTIKNINGITSLLIKLGRHQWSVIWSGCGIEGVTRICKTPRQAWIKAFQGVNKQIKSRKSALTK
jgi:hypothetical protein